MTGLSIALMGLLLLSIVINFVQRRMVARLLWHIKDVVAAANRALELLEEVKEEAYMRGWNDREGAFLVRPAAMGLPTPTAEDDTRTYSPSTSKRTTHRRTPSPR